MIVRAVSSFGVEGFWSPTLSPKAGERMGHPIVAPAACVSHAQNLLAYPSLLA